MLLSSRLPLKNLIELCRALRHNLDAGLTLVRIFEQQSQRGSAAVRPLAARIHRVLKHGHDLKSALKAERDVLPPLFLSLASVGERTGTLPEVLGSLEAYYTTQQRLIRDLVAKSTMPVLQLLAAIFVIAGMIFILGLIAPAGQKPLDPLGVGLTGTSGALIFLGLAFGSLGSLVGAYWLAGKHLQQRAAVDRFLLRLPAVGPCLYALALSRFCVAFRATLETAMSIDEALQLSLRATGNAAFAVAAETTIREVRGGKSVLRAITRAQVFDSDFKEVVAVAEESGRLPEVMKQQARYYDEVAEQRLGLLMRAASFGIWLFVAILIIVAIFRIYTTVIMAAYNV